MTIRLLAPAAFALAGPLAALSPAVAADAAGANAKIAIARAVEAAEAKGGGKAVAADFDDDDGGRWQVKVVAKGGERLTTYFVDPNSGAVKGEEEQTLERFFTILKPEDFAKARTTLPEAITVAEALAKGRAIAAEVERESGSVAYEIDVATTEGERDVKVDATGEAKIH